LYSTERTKELGKQWTHLKNTILPSEYSKRPLPQFSRFWCLLASCWSKQNQTYIDWRHGDIADEMPLGVKNTNDWKELRSALMQARNCGMKDVISVHCEDKARLMYAIAPL
jgi:hypothetical protein